MWAVLLANPISNQVRTFTNNLPHIVNEANSQIAGFQAELNKHGIHAKLVSQGKTALQTLQDQISKSTSELATFGGALLTEVAKALVDLVLVFVLSVYMLVYGQSIGRLVRQAMPTGDGTPADDYPRLAQHAVSRYVGGQLLFSVIMGASTGIALYLFGVLGIFPDGRKYALAFGVFYGVMELIPYIGPILARLRWSWPCLPTPSAPCGWPSCSSGCSSWRGTWSRPRSSVTRCASILCL